MTDHVANSGNSESQEWWETAWQLRSKNVDRVCENLHYIAEGLAQMYAIDSTFKQGIEEAETLLQLFRQALESKNRARLAS